MIRVIGIGYIILLTLLEGYGQQKTVCISIDDLPVVNYGITKNNFKQKVTQSLINTFEKYKIPAIGFVNEKKLYHYKDSSLKPSEVNLLRLWTQNGYELGNHTFSHPNYDKVSFEFYTNDILQGSKVTPSLCAEAGLKYQYFRHPYLRRGNTKESFDSLNTFLAEQGLIVAPVTIDNGDYLFAKAYSDAFKKKDKELQQRIGKAYIEYMKEKILYFEGRSIALFGRNIAHTLLLHANLLNAEYLDELAQVFVELGYSFASQSEVLKDPLYNTPTTRFGSWGISWIDSWALSMGKKGDFFKDDPPVPFFITSSN